jgi:hypothetical protein
MAQPSQTQNQSLVWARENLATAMSMPDAHGRIQYAHSAKDYAAEAVLDSQSTPEDKAAARDIVVKAMAITGELRRLSPARQEIALQSHGIEID